MMQERIEEARYNFLEALQINPRYADALQNLGVLLVTHGDVGKGNHYLSEAVRLDPDAGLAYAKLALVLHARGETSAAVDFYREFLRLKPDDEKVCNNLAWILATNPDPKLRDGATAVRLAEHACELSQYKETVFIGTLAAGYAEVGRFQEAVATAQKAVELARLTGQKELEQKNRELLNVYAEKKAYHEERPSGRDVGGRGTKVE
jgi:Flp pilus assembly protein TadD